MALRRSCVRRPDAAVRAGPAWLVLRPKLRAFHVASGQRYGRPKLWKDLHEDGEAVRDKRVADG